MTCCEEELTCLQVFWSVAFTFTCLDENFAFLTMLCYRKAWEEVAVVARMPDPIYL